MDVSEKVIPIREGEEIDSARVEAFLKDSIPGLSGELSILQFPSGFSNLTYLLKIGGTEFVLRRPPVGTKARTAHDMDREYRMLKALRPAFPYCPEPLLYTEDSSILGCPFYVMERIQGIILRSDLPPGLVFTPQQARALCERLLDVHIELHSIDYRAIGLEGYGRPKGYVQRQVTGWSQRYRDARTPDAPDCEAVMGWLAEKMPPDTPEPSIVHNDFKFDNIVLDPLEPLKIVGVLDWELATVGDPLMDLGNSLAYWIQRDDPPEMRVLRLMPTDMEGALTRGEIVERYAQRSGRSVTHFEYYSCFGLFRLAVIAQQIYYRYYHGQTKDDRFKTLVAAVKVLEEAATRVMEGSAL